MATGNLRGGSLFGVRLAPREARLPEPAAPLPPASIDVTATVMRLNARAAAASSVAQFLERSQAAPLLQTADLGCRPPVMQDMVSPWLAYWARELNQPVRAHRKLWEYAVVLQAFYEAGVLKPGSRALGFGVGDEPLPSYLASLGMQVLASDMPGVTDPEAIFHEQFLPSEEFEARVEVSDIHFGSLSDPSLRDFDACWSCSVVGDLGADYIAQEAIIKSMDVLRPGGLAVHLMEFAFAPDVPRDHNDMFFPRGFFESLERGLNGRGHKVRPVSFALGTHPLDAYVDIPNLDVHGALALEDLWHFDPPAPHLKVAVGDLMITSFALIVTCRD